jgi:hypothetical protein
VVGVGMVLMVLRVEDATSLPGALTLAGALL